MAERPPSKAAKPPGADAAARQAAAEAAREARLAEALRANLKRRKAQARGRRDAAGDDESQDK